VSNPVDEKGMRRAVASYAAGMRTHAVATTGERFEKLRDLEP
jgi:hypothetical protein